MVCQLIILGQYVPPAPTISAWDHRALRCTRNVGRVVREQRRRRAAAACSPGTWELHAEAVARPGQPSKRECVMGCLLADHRHDRPLLASFDFWDHRAYRARTHMYTNVGRVVRAQRRAAGGC